MTADPIIGLTILALSVVFLVLLVVRAVMAARRPPPRTTRWFRDI